MNYSIETIKLNKNFQHINNYRDILLHPFKKEEYTVLHDINIQVMPQQIFSLLGPSGAGKTTLIKILSTLILPTSGKAIINGCDVTQKPMYIKNSIGYVLSDERSFYWRLTGRQNLKFFAKLNNINNKAINRIIDHVLELTSLNTISDQMFKNYSAGQRQKLAIARALLTNPQILIMDEPTRSLDPGTAQNLRNFVKKMVIEEHGKTVFFTTHNLEEAESISDSLAIIYNGRIKVQGKLKQIIETINDSKEYIIGLDSSVNSIVSKIKPFFPDNEICLSPDSNNIIVKLKKKNYNISEVLEKIVSHGGQVQSCVLKKASLQDVYNSIIDQAKNHES